MGWLKRLEIAAKLLLATVVAGLLWRPRSSRRGLAALASADRVLVVRIDNRVGEALLTTPLLTSLRQRHPRVRVDVLVHSRVARVLEGHPDADRVIAFDRRWLALGPFAPGIRALRRERYPVVINCANWTVPSVTAAIVSRLIGFKGIVIGPLTPPTPRLQSVSVPPRADTRSELVQRLHLTSAIPGTPEVPRLSFRTPRPTAEIRELIARLAGGPFAVVNPGGRLGFRRIPPSAFASAARALLGVGRTPLVTWGPGEEAMAQEVMALTPGAELAPPTQLDDLAALMQAAGCTICNNTGPMHLSVAVGAPTLGLFLRMEMARWGHDYAPHRMVDLTAVIDRGEDLDAAVAAAVRSFALGLPAQRTVG